MKKIHFIFVGVFIYCLQFSNAKKEMFKKEIEFPCVTQLNIEEIAVSKINIQTEEKLDKCTIIIESNHKDYLEEIDLKVENNILKIDQAFKNRSFINKWNEKKVFITLKVPSHLNAHIKVIGGSDVELGNLQGNLELQSHGSCKFNMKNLEGNLTLKLHGSAKLNFENITAQSIFIDEKGSAVCVIKAIKVDDFNADLKGSSKIHVEELNVKNLIIDEKGSSKCEIKIANIENLKVNVMGASVIHINSGEIHKSDIQVFGMSALYLPTVHDLNVKKMGAGKVITKKVMNQTNTQ